MIVDMPREAKVGGGVWHEYILLLKKKKTAPSLRHSDWRNTASEGAVGGRHSPGQ